MRTTKIALILGILLILIALPTAAFAQSGGNGDQVIFGGSYTLESGESLNGDLVVFGGNVELETDSRVDGDILIFGGTITVDGEIDGDLIVIGGSVDLEENAVLHRDLITPGGSVYRAEGAQIFGQVITETNIPVDITIPRIFTEEFPRDIPQPVVPTPRVYVSGNPFWGVIWFFFRTLAFAALAVLVIMFAPKQAERAANTVLAQPILSGGLGILTIIVAIPLLVILMITIILIPVSLLGLLLLAVAGLFGWITLGMEVGQRLSQLFNSEWPAAVAAGVGTFALTMVTFGIGEIPCIGWVAPFLVTSVGLGAVILTRFGTQTYPPEDMLPVPVGAPIPDPSPPEVIDAILADEDEEAPEEVE